MASETWIYVNYIEPFFCLGYVWLLWRIKRSHVQELQSAFFTFFVLCGISSCANILVIGLKRLGNFILTEVQVKDIIFNMLVFGSHCFSFCHTIGKALIIGTRFTAICYPLKIFWTRCRVRMATCLMFLIPVLLYSFMIPPKAIYRRNEAGYNVYIGVEEWAQELSKLISASTYLIFIGVSIPMCVASIFKLRKAQLFNENALVKQERAMLIYTILITLVHLLKSAQQIFWFITMVIKNDQLFDLATKMYNHFNALTTFVPPILLLVSSRLVRHEVFSVSRSRSLHYNPAIAQSSSLFSPSTGSRNTNQ